MYRYLHSIFMGEPRHRRSVLCNGHEKLRRNCRGNLKFPIEEFCIKDTLHLIVSLILTLILMFGYLYLKFSHVAIQTLIKLSLFYPKKVVKILNSIGWMAVKVDDDIDDDEDDEDYVVEEVESSSESTEDDQSESEEADDQSESDAADGSSEEGGELEAENVDDEKELPSNKDEIDSEDSAETVPDLISVPRFLVDSESGELYGSHPLNLKNKQAVAGSDRAETTSKESDSQYSTPTTGSTPVKNAPADKLSQESSFLVNAASVENPMRFQSVS